MVMKRPTYDSQPSRRIRKSTEPNYYLLIRSKRYCHLCANYSVPRHLLEVDHYYNDNNKYDLRENVKPLQRDDPENLWVLCKYCHSRKNHWESIGDYLNITYRPSNFCKLSPLSLQNFCTTAMSVPIQKSLTPISI